jgi:hypothetical protein
MVAELAKTLLEFIKLAPRFVFALGIAAGALLVANDHFLKRIGLTEFVQKLSLRARAYDRIVGGTPDRIYRVVVSRIDQEVVGQAPLPQNRY